MARSKPRISRSPDPSPPPLSPSPRRPFPKEWIAIVAITLLAAALRFAYPDRMAIEHFDEGVYASNIFFGEAAGGQYPYRHLYAPPLLPWLIEWGIIFLGPESIAPFLPALVLGIATVPLMWWVGRSWFGPLAGLAAALLVATSDFHILYSRAGLTDVPVMFFVVLAVYLYFEAVRRESLKWAVWAGLATGLAWWTKYTGWLPLAIALAGSAGWVVGDLRSGWPRMRERGIKVGWCWGAMAVTAFVVWLPVLYGLQEYGGYAAVAENHSGYLISEPSGWFSNAYLQAIKLNLLSGAATGIGLALVAGSILLMGKNRQWWHWLGAALLAFGFLLATASLGPLVTMGLLAVAGLLLEAFWRLRRPLEDNGEPGRSTLALWLLTAWLFGMALTTPLYTPYPRMVFPWLFAAILLCCRWLANSERTRVPREGWSRGVVLGGVMLLIMPGIMITLFEAADVLTGGAHEDLRLVEFPAWQDRTGAKRAAEEFANTIRAGLNASDPPIVVYVYGEPALYFHLRAMFSGDDVAVLAAGSPDAVKARVPKHLTFMIIDQEHYSALWNKVNVLPRSRIWFGSHDMSLLVRLDSPNGQIPSSSIRTDSLPNKGRALMRIGDDSSEQLLRPCPFLPVSLTIHILSARKQPSKHDPSSTPRLLDTNDDPSTERGDARRYEPTRRLGHGWTDARRTQPRQQRTPGRRTAGPRFVCGASRRRASRAATPAWSRAQRAVGQWRGQ